jgi:hypothetical protein
VMKTYFYVLHLGGLNLWYKKYLKTLLRFAFIQSVWNCLAKVKHTVTLYFKLGRTSCDENIFLRTSFWRLESSYLESSKDQGSSDLAVFISKETRKTVTIIKGLHIVIIFLAKININSNV